MFNSERIKRIEDDIRYLRIKLNVVGDLLTALINTLGYKVYDKHEKFSFKKVTKEKE